ncbi:MAG: tRNA (adenosine(37)-N6)-threonylcarbamoyltransferase complex dimerization subunit type 1 TsaB [Saprospiraceae bacterium]
MALILCLETATEACSVALGDGGKLVALNRADAPMDHAARLTTLITSCLENAGKGLRSLDAVAVSRGPGSYTSLRIGYSTAKGIAYGLGIPVLEIDTLQALAVQGTAAANRPGALCCAMLDARRMEAYYAIYTETGQQLQPPVAAELTPDMFDDYYAQGAFMVFTGNAVEKFSTIHVHARALFSPMAASAETFPALAEKKFREGVFADTAYCEPLYLKPPNITQARAVL